MIMASARKNLNRRRNSESPNACSGIKLAKEYAYIHPLVLSHHPHRMKTLKLWSNRSGCRVPFVNASARKKLKDTKKFRISKGSCNGIMLAKEYACIHT